jgi:hypothetical protein
MLRVYARRPGRARQSRWPGAPRSRFPSTLTRYALACRDMWEYLSERIGTKGFWGGKVDMKDFQALLTQHGQAGWELVSVFDTAIHQGSSRDVVLVFKRPARAAPTA